MVIEEDFIRVPSGHPWLQLPTTLSSIKLLSWSSTIRYSLASQGYLFWGEGLLSQQEMWSLYSKMLWKMKKLARIRMLKILRDYLKKKVLYMVHICFGKWNFSIDIFLKDLNCLALRKMENRKKLNFIPVNKRWLETCIHV